MLRLVLCALVLTACMAPKEEDIPRIEGSITVLDDQEWDLVLGLESDPFEVDTVWFANDSLYITVKYSGGCEEHEFWAFSSCAWKESGTPQASLIIIHDNHNDLCEAYLTEVLKLDASTLSTCSSGSIYVIMHIGDTGKSAAIQL